MAEQAGKHAAHPRRRRCCCLLVAAAAAAGEARHPPRRPTAWACRSAEEEGTVRGRLWRRRQRMAAAVA